VVFDDQNENGAPDDGEPRLPGVHIWLVSSDGLAREEITDAEGVYRFADLRPGEYSLAVVVPKGYFRPVALPTTVVIAANTTTEAHIPLRAYRITYLPLVIR